MTTTTSADTSAATDTPITTFTSATTTTTTTTTALLSEQAFEVRLAHLVASRAFNKDHPRRAKGLRQHVKCLLQSEKDSDSINRNSIIRIRIKIRNNQEDNIIIDNLKEREKNNPSLEKNNLLLEEEKIP
ncbi:hypothetical protein BGX38DRAFT_1276554 [Terfezia claveryi]|nr:hypothetical protein BGX38DRAFT_1276554 [Terfezia claveryi]